MPKRGWFVLPARSRRISVMLPTVKSRPLHTERTAVQHGPELIQRRTISSARKAHMLGYQHHAHGFEIKRVVGFGLANLGATSQHAELAHIRGFVNGHTSDDASDHRGAERQLQ